MLRFTRNTVIAFDFKDALSFEGETGPYVQYAIVRAANTPPEGLLRPRGLSHFSDQLHRSFTCAWQCLAMTEIDELLLHLRGLVFVRALVEARGATAEELELYAGEIERVRRELADASRAAAA